MKVNQICIFCNNQFIAESKEIKRGGGLYCSMKCSGADKSLKHAPKAPNVKCALCEKAFYKSLSRIKLSKSGLFFCSRMCKDKAQRIGGIKDIQPEHYGEYLANYRDSVEKARGINSCENCGYDEHPEILQVHHKNRNRKDNSLDNLIVLCPNCHLWEHYISKDGLYSRRGAACTKAGEESLQDF